MCSTFIQSMLQAFKTSVPQKKIIVNKNKGKVKTSQHIEKMKNNLDAIAVIAKVTISPVLYDEYQKYKCAYKTAFIKD